MLQPPTFFRTTSLADNDDFLAKCCLTLPHPWSTASRQAQMPRKQARLRRKILLSRIQGRAPLPHRECAEIREAAPRDQTAALQ
jgi:hypothetical protein